MTEEDPLSTQSITVHLLKLIIFLVGGCVIEAIKHSWEPPLFTSAILNVGELTMFIYMLGALGQAFHWSWSQWSRGQPIFAEGEKNLLKQFLPKRINLRTAFKPPKFLLRLVIYIIAVLLILFIFEMIQMKGTNQNSSQIRLSSNDNRTLSNIEDRIYYFVRPRSLPKVLVSGFNVLSLRMLGGAAILSALAVFSVVLVIIHNKRKMRHSHSKHSLDDEK